MVAVEATSPQLNGTALSARTQALNLFLVGFLVLFLELAFIRWLAAYVIFIRFFTNVVLIASFLGMSCGCLAARQRRDWLRYFPFIALATVTAGIGMLVAYHYWTGLAIEVGRQASPQEVFFGTEYRNPDVAEFVIPIEAIAAFFFVLVALMFVGLGQVLGRAFDAYPSRVGGYALNIGGSLAGIVAFSAASMAQAPPLVWLLAGCGGVAYLLYQIGRLSRIGMLALVAVVVWPSIPLEWLFSYHETHWSPYYLVDLDKRVGSIEVDNMGHQTMVPFAASGSVYSLIHLLNRHSGGKPFEDILIVGAGSGNDVAHSLRFDAKHIDAVEIDPVLQDLGVRYHPDRPYQDPRVVRHLDDGRHYLRTADRRYDLVVYALVDSLILHSSYGNLRLESFLFTDQAFADVQRVLKPGGTFVMYNYLRQGWIVERIAAMAESTFGCPPLVFSLPFAETLKSTDRAGFTVLIAGCNKSIAESFARHPEFWLDTVPPKNLDIDGFAVRTAESERISPLTLIHDGGPVIETTDDWPFLYLRGRLIPNLTLRSMLMMGVLGLGMVYFFLPAGRAAFHNRMFFLGAAFMLLETKAVVQMALLFGSTWVVNSLVFFFVLVLILLANFYVLKMPEIRLSRHYAALLLLLVASALIPLDVFLGGNAIWHYVLPCVLSLGPMLFAGVIFAHSFRDASNPDYAFGSNIAGSVVGGLCEPLSTLLGFRYLILLAIAFYILSMWSPRSLQPQSA